MIRNTHIFLSGKLNDLFAAGYKSGMTMVEIAKRNNVSERTIYRYKAYYDKMREEKDNE